MNKWSVESLCLGVAAVVLAVPLGLGWIAFSDPGQATPSLHLLRATMAALAAAALLLILRVRARLIARNAVHARLRQIQRRYRHFVDTAHEGIWVVDNQSITVFANARLGAMFGAPSHALLGRDMASFMGDNPRATLSELLSPEHAAAGRNYDLCYRRLDGSVGWALASAQPMRDDAGRHEATLLMLTDISERKSTELELAAIQIGLEVRIKMRTAELERINAKLRKEMDEHAATERQLAMSFKQLRELTAHLETLKEQERKLIAKDIHDELGQNLMALKIDVEMLHARAGSRHPLLKRKVGCVLDTIDLTIRSVRAIINDLHPSTLELGLPAASEWLIDQFEKRSGIMTTLHVSGSEDMLPDSGRTAVIFRIIQEALVNILRHAQARHVDVTLDMRADWLAIGIVDDGVGMQPEDAGKAASFGLRGIQERVEVFGGHLLIDSAPGRGTSLSILIPMQESAADATYLQHNDSKNETFSLS